MWLASPVMRPMRLGPFVVAVAALVGCTRRGSELKAGALIAQQVAKETVEAREGRPRTFLNDNTGPACEVFGKYLQDCPRVPSCEDVRRTEQTPQLNVCINERSALSRVASCGSAREQNESRCTLATFTPCARLAGARCEFDLAVCETDDRTLAVASCCNDPAGARCVRDRYALLPRR